MKFVIFYYFVSKNVFQNGVRVMWQSFCRKRKPETLLLEIALEEHTGGGWILG
jgi:hypothetical protein